MQKDYLYPEGGKGIGGWCARCKESQQPKKIKRKLDWILARAAGCARS